MKNWDGERSWRWIWRLLKGAALFALLLCLLNCQPQCKVRNNLMFLKEGWLSAGVEDIRQKVALPSSQRAGWSQDPVRLLVQLPEQELPNAYLSIVSCSQFLKVELDGDSLYDYEDPSLQSPKRVLYLIPLPEDYRGKTLNITLCPSYAFPVRSIPSLVVGSPADLFVYYLIQETEALLGGVLMTLLGFISLAAIWLVTWRKGERPPAEQIFCGVCLSTGIWILTGSCTVSLLFGDAPLPHFLNSIALYLALILFFRRLSLSCEGWRRQVMMGMAGIFTILFFIELFGKMENRLFFYRLGPLVTGVLALGAVGVAIVFLPEIFQNKEKRPLIPLTVNYLLFVLLDQIGDWYPFLYRRIYTIFSFFTALVFIGCLLNSSNRHFVMAQERSLHSRQLEQQLEQQARYYEKIQRAQKELWYFCHDAANYYRTLYILLQQEKYTEALHFLEQTSSGLQESNAPLITGNPVLDAIITEKQALAESRKIPIKRRIAIPPRLKVAPADWVAILSNALDNAIEACLSLPPEQRFLEIFLTYRGQLLHIEISNPWVGRRREFFVSTKGREGHGLGIPRIKAAAGRYGGTVQYRLEKGRCMLEIIFPELPADTTPDSSSDSSGETVP